MPTKILLQFVSSRQVLSLSFVSARQVLYSSFVFRTHYFLPKKNNKITLVRLITFWFYPTRLPVIIHYLHQTFGLSKKGKHIIRQTQILARHCHWPMNLQNDWNCLLPSIWDGHVSGITFTSMAAISDGETGGDQSSSELIF